MNQTKPAIRFAKAMCRTVLATVLIALMPAAILPVTAQEGEEQPRWFGSTDGRSTMLLYGVPDSDYVMLYFSCTVGKPMVSVNVQDEESRAEEGAAMQVRLSAGGEKVEFSEKAIPNEDSGGKDVKASLPLDDTLRRILTATGTLEIVVDGHTQRYALAGAAEPAAAMIAACDTPKPASDLDVTVTNKATKALESFAYSQAGVNELNSDAFGYETLAPGASREFTIPGGRDICTFDISVIFVAEDDEECCSMGEPAGTQNLCENAEFVVHD
ncbi:MAG: hypothetical protein WBA42_09075 [Mesorhizobium sp.]